MKCKHFISLSTLYNDPTESDNLGICLATARKNKKNDSLEFSIVDDRNECVECEMFSPIINDEQGKDSIIATLKKHIPYDKMRKSPWFDFEVELFDGSALGVWIDNYYGSYQIRSSCGQFEEFRNILKDYEIKMVDTVRLLVSKPNYRIMTIDSSSWPSMKKLYIDSLEKYIKGRETFAKHMKVIKQTIKDELYNEIMKFTEKYGTTVIKPIPDTYSLIDRILVLYNENEIVGIFMVYIENEDSKVAHISYIEHSKYIVKNAIEMLISSLNNDFEHIVIDLNINYLMHKQVLEEFDFVNVETRHIRYLIVNHETNEIYELPYLQRLDEVYQNEKLDIWIRPGYTRYVLTMPEMDEYDPLEL